MKYFVKDKVFRDRKLAEAYAAACRTAEEFRGGVASTFVQEFHEVTELHDVGKFIAIMKDYAVGEDRKSIEKVID